jgi:hypothetical protein
MQAVRSWYSSVASCAGAGLVTLACMLAGGGAAATTASAQEPGPNLFTTIGITRSETRANSQIAGNPPYSLPAEEMPPSRTVGAPPDDDFDNVPLRMPDTSGNLPNLAAFRGQVLTLRPEAKKQYSKIHFFGTTTDGGPAGGVFVLRYSDDTTQSIQVQFRDWCNPQDSAAHHVAIGPLSQRYRTTGGDTAQCAIFHVPANAQAGKTLVSVTFPATTTPGDPPIQGYLMALTLEQSDGVFEMPDLSGRVPVPGDDIPPVTSHAFAPADPDGQGGWYTDPVAVTLTATDEGGSQVEQMMYRVDGGPPQAYGGPFRLDSDGEHKLEYRSIDGSGNAETFKSTAVKVDVHAPTTTASPNPGLPFGIDGWHDGAVKVSLTARDASGSGTAGTEYRLDGGEWQQYGSPITVEEAGIHELEYRSKDVAGNVEAARSLAVKVDKTAPVTTARINGAAPQADYQGGARVAFIRTDGDGSGAVTTEYRIGDGGWTPYTGAFDLAALGGYRIDYRSRDLVGNVENYRSVLFTIRPGPIVTGTPPAARRPAPFAALVPVARGRSTIAALRQGKLAVRVSCQSVERGTLRLTVNRAVARKLHLASRVLAERSVRCGAEGRGTVTLKVSRRVKRQLARSRGTVHATLTLRMSGSAGAAEDRMPVALRQGAEN